MREPRDAYSNHVKRDDVFTCCTSVCYIASHKLSNARPRTSRDRLEMERVRVVDHVLNLFLAVIICGNFWSVGRETKQSSISIFRPFGLTFPIGIEIMDEIEPAYQLWSVTVEAIPTSNS